MSPLLLESAGRRSSPEPAAAPCARKLTKPRHRFSHGQCSPWLLPLLSRPALAAHAAVPSADGSTELLLPGACETEDGIGKEKVGIVNRLLRGTPCRGGIMTSGRDIVVIDREFQNLRSTVELELGSLRRACALSSGSCSQLLPLSLKNTTNLCKYLLTFTCPNRFLTKICHINNLMILIL